MIRYNGREESQLSQPFHAWWLPDVGCVFRINNNSVLLARYASFLSCVCYTQPHKVRDMRTGLQFRAMTYMVIAFFSFLLSISLTFHFLFLILLFCSMIDDVCITYTPEALFNMPFFAGILQAFINWQNVHKVVILLERLRKSSEDLEETSFMVKLALTVFHKDLPWWLFAICYGGDVPRAPNENSNWKCRLEPYLAKWILINNHMISLVLCTIVFFFLTLPVNMSLGDSSSSKSKFINN